MIKIKLWIDDVRPAPPEYFHCKSTKGAKQVIKLIENWLNKYELALKEDDLPLWREKGIKEEIEKYTIEIIDINHDADDYTSNDVDYLKLLDWLEETGRNYPIRIHS